jgi:hypothetical protein
MFHDIANPDRAGMTSWMEAGHRFGGAVFAFLDG